MIKTIRPESIIEWFNKVGITYILNNEPAPSVYISPFATADSNPIRAQVLGDEDGGTSHITSAARKEYTGTLAYNDIQLPAGARILSVRSGIDFAFETATDAAAQIRVAQVYYNAGNPNPQSAWLDTVARIADGVGHHAYTSTAKTTHPATSADWTQDQVNNLNVQAELDPAALFGPGHNVIISELWSEVEIYRQGEADITNINDGDIVPVNIVVNWSVTAPDQGAPQEKYILKAYDPDVYNAPGFDPQPSGGSTAAYSSGIITSTTDRTKTTSGLTAGITYKLYLWVDQTWAGTAATWYMEPAVVTALTTLVYNTPTLTVVADTDNARMALTITGTAPNDGKTETYFAQRSADGGTTWEDVRQVTPWTATFPGQVNTYYDYEAVPNVDLKYRVRAKGTITKFTAWSAWSTVYQAPALYLKDWWLKNPYNPADNITIDVVPSFDTTIDEQQAVFHPLGSLPVVVSDALSGEDGELKIQTISRDIWNELRPMLRKQQTLLLQSPFIGTQWYIRITGPRKTQLFGYDFVEAVRETSYSYVELEAPSVPAPPP